jgi:hypothetical protein
MVLYPRSKTIMPFIRSDDLEFILCGMADDPTWPDLKPSLTKPLPAINLIVVAIEEGAEAICNSLDTTSKSTDRG